MESRPEDSHGVEIPKKSRSLDLKSLYGNMDSKPRGKRKGGVDGGGSDGTRSERKKSRKEASVSSFKFLGRNGSKSLKEVYNGCFNTSSRDSGHNGTGNENGGDGCILKGLNDGVANVPRRKRDFVGRRKVESGGVVVKPVEDVDIVGRLAGEDEDQKAESQRVEIKQNSDVDAPVEQGNREVNSDRHVAEDAQATDSAGKCGDSVLKNSGSEHVVENGGDPLVKTSYRKRSRKRKKVVPVVESVTAEVQPPADTSSQVPGDLRGEDEENLEENAAMMLSSRFDPSCTGFSNGNAPSGNGASIESSSGRKIKRGSTFGSSNRALRPRKLDEEGKSKVRRNYYKIIGDLDVYWALNKRIKVFWPLDKTWYSGHVGNYDEESKLHHIKYDDRDEEWVDLRKERFKLLLFPSEVPGRANNKRMGTRRKHVDEEIKRLKVSERNKRVLTSENDSRLGNDADSEPIISLLSRSAAQAKPSPLQALKKKEKISHLSGIPKLLTEEAVNGSILFDRLPSYQANGGSSVYDQVASQRREAFAMDSSNCAGDKKLIVYHRKRFHKARGALYHMAKAKRGSPHVPYLDPFTPVVSHRVIEEYNIFLSKWDMDRSCDSMAAIESFWSTSNAGLPELNIPLIESRGLRFKLSFPVTFAPNYSFGTENIRLFHAAALLQYGMLIALWPRVYLEMLFVDNMVGLRCFMFEGSLKHLVAYLFMVLAAFECKEQKKCDDFVCPETSVRFKFSCIQDCRKQFVFAFCNFNVMESSKWTYLDQKLRKYCFLSQQLPLPECTCHNLKVLQNGSYPFIKSSVLEDSSATKGMQKKSKQGLGLMNISRETIRVNAIQSPAFNQDQGFFPLFTPPFTAAPTFFLGLHIKLLMKRNVISFQNCPATDCTEDSHILLADGSCSLEYCSGKSAEGRYDHVIKDPSKDSDVDRSSSFKLSDPQIVDGCESAGVRSSGVHKTDTGNTETYAASAITSSPSKLDVDSYIPTLNQQCRNGDLQKFDLLPQMVADGGKPDCVPHNEDIITIDVPSFENFGTCPDQLDGAQPHTDLSWNMSGGVIPSPNPTARRSSWHRNRNNSASFGSFSHGWSDTRGEFLQHNFTTGPKKPRTQVSYTLPVGSFDYGSKNRSHHLKGPNKRIRTPYDKKLHDGSKGPERNLESLSCGANVLVTVGDRGWRECGAQVALQLFDHNEWKLAVKVSGSTKFSYKAHQFLQPGSTNRYTHAMMWKGEKDWVLEFTDRSQWALFKEMHEECYNRNIRAASVKNIPIPGVRLIEYDENGVEVPFLRSLKYFRQVETDVEMALNPSKVLYDMDSDDEEWMLRTQTSSSAESRIPCDMFEEVMDKFEKVAYSQQRDHFTADEIEDFLAGVAPIEVTKTIHEYWQQKRQKKGMPLIRHLQPPLWEKYQQEVKELELEMTKNSAIMLNSRHEKAASVEKPLMFAFCLKPRGLELLNKGSKQRSHRKLSVAGQSNFFSGDHDGFHSNGRKANGYMFWDERYSYELLEESLYPQVFPRVISPRDAAGSGVSFNGDRFNRGHCHKLQRSKSRKFASFNDRLMVSSGNQRMFDNRNGHHWLDMDYFESPGQRPYYDWSKPIPRQLDDDPDSDESRLRGASGAAKHAVNLAKLKRERAQRLLYRADLSIHKAVVALMTAESMKASSEDVNNDG